MNRVMRVISGYFLVQASVGAYVRTVFIVALVLMGVSFHSIAAEKLPETTETSQRNAAEASPPLTEENVSAWLDGYIPTAMQRDRIPGAVVIIVKDGHVLVSKGYGYANEAEKIRVEPDHTLFRVGSISKLFTATAVLQLAEEGKLDLDRDINTYLDFRIPDRDDGPITLRHLLTHTAGFEEHISNIEFEDPSILPTLSKCLRHSIPKRIFQAGSTPAYSNYGFALAGYIVQRVSGQLFDDYIEQHVLKPLEMSSSSFRQPLPSELSPFVATPYIDGKPEGYYRLICYAPAGSLSTTAADISHFMIAFLQGAQFEGSALFTSKTVSTLFDESAQLYPPLDAKGLIFFVTHRNGLKIVGHSGAVAGFFSNLSLIPEKNVGIFISVNAENREAFAHKLWINLQRDFLDRYVPFTRPDSPPVTSASVDGHLVAGPYEKTRRSQSNFLSIQSLLDQITIDVQNDGTLISKGLTDQNGHPKIWRETAPLLWDEIGGQDQLIAKVHQGHILSFADKNELQAQVYLRVPKWRSAAWIVPTFELSVFVVAIAVLLPLMTIVSRVVNRQPWKTRSIYSGLGIATWAAALFNLLLLMSWAAWLFILSSNGALAMRASEAVVIALEWVSWGTLLSAIVGLRYCVSAWASGKTVWAKGSGSALLAALLLQCWVAFVFHLMGSGSTNY